MWIQFLLIAAIVVLQVIEHREAKRYEVRHPQDEAQFRRDLDSWGFDDAYRR